MVCRSLIILGTGGGAHDVLDILEAINIVRPTWQVAGFLDDSRTVGSKHLSLPILGRLSEATKFDSHHEFINVIGSDASYRRRSEILLGTHLPTQRFATLVHPWASVSSRAKLGDGVCVNYGASVGGGSVIGNHVSLGPGSIIGHDSVVEEYTMIAPGAIVSGFVRVGRNCYIGAGAMVRQRLAIGDSSLVGMGAVVVGEIQAGETVVGNPGRVLRQSTPKRDLANCGEIELSKTEDRHR